MTSPSRLMTRTIFLPRGICLQFHIPGLVTGGTHGDSHFYYWQADRKLWKVNKFEDNVEKQLIIVCFNVVVVWGSAVCCLSRWSKCDLAGHTWHCAGEGGGRARLPLIGVSGGHEMAQHNHNSPQTGKHSHQYHNQLGLGTHIMASQPHTVSSACGLGWHELQTTSVPQPGSSSYLMYGCSLICSLVTKYFSVYN